MNGNGLKIRFDFVLFNIRVVQATIKGGFLMRNSIMKWSAAYL